MKQEAAQNPLTTLSSELANVVEQVAPSVVRVDDGTRLTATGILWSADGAVLTTSHGVERDEDLSIEQADGSVLPATLAGRDPETDLALLRVQATGLPAVRRAPPEEVKVGHLVLALGRPGNSGLQATLGIIGARREAQGSGWGEYILNTDATLHPGFSGGPLVNMSGQVVGLTNLAFGRGAGVALGVPILAHVAEALLAQGRVRRGYLGVSTQSVTLPDSLRQALAVEQKRGLLVVQVSSDSPAERGGLILGDMLLGVADRIVQDADALRKQLRSMQAGETVTLPIVRGGERRDLTVTLGEQE